MNDKRNNAKWISEEQLSNLQFIALRLKGSPISIEFQYAMAELIQLIVSAIETQHITEKDTNEHRD